VSPGGDRRTYLRPGQLRELVSAFDLLSSWEGVGPEHHHGDGRLERHALAEAVLVGR
jgi:hypothetical protein